MTVVLLYITVLSFHSTDLLQHCSWSVVVDLVVVVVFCFCCCYNIICWFLWAFVFKNALTRCTVLSGQFLSSFKWLIITF